MFDSDWLQVSGVVWVDKHEGNLRLRPLFITQAHNPLSAGLGIKSARVRNPNRKTVLKLKRATP